MRSRQRSTRHESAAAFNVAARKLEGDLAIQSTAVLQLTGHRHVTTVHMTPTAKRPADAVPAIIASGRDITADDVEMIWADFIEGRYSWQETSERAIALVKTVNVPSHVANGGLLNLYYMWQPGADRDPESHKVKREQWRELVKQCDADPLEWDRPFYQDMIRRRAAKDGIDSARHTSAITC